MAVPALLCCSVALATPHTGDGAPSEEYSPLAEAYIRNYQQLAIAEMERTSIPASIT